MTQGEVISLINYMNQILLSMYVFANVIVILNKASASYKRCADVLSQKPGIVKESMRLQVTIRTLLLMIMFRSHTIQ